MFICLQVRKDGILFSDPCTTSISTNMATYGVNEVEGKADTDLEGAVVVVVDGRVAGHVGGQVRVLVGPVVWLLLGLLHHGLGGGVVVAVARVALGLLVARVALGPVLGPALAVRRRVGTGVGRRRRPVAARRGAVAVVGLAGRVVRAARQRGVVGVGVHTGG